MSWQYLKLYKCLQKNKGGEGEKIQPKGKTKLMILRWGI